MRHADAETLAAFREELLPARKAGRVSAHLASCPRCAALDAQLAGVTTLLSRTTAPPMPEALTARIEAALAAEAAARSAAAAVPGAAPAAVPGTAGPGAGGPNGARSPAGRGPSRPGHGRSWLTLRVAAAAAAVAVIAGGGYGVAQVLSSGSPTPLNASSGSGAVGAPAARRPVAPRMSAGGGLGPAAGSAHANLIAPLVVSSGTNYQPGRLGAQASAVLSRYALRPAGSPTPTARPAPQHRVSALFPALQDCVAHVAGGKLPLLVDLARYQGHPAAIVILPATTAAPPRAVVLAPGCTSTKAHILAQSPLH